MSNIINAIGNHPNVSNTFVGVCSVCLHNIYNNNVYHVLYNNARICENCATESAITVCNECDSAFLTRDIYSGAAHAFFNEEGEFCGAICPKCNANREIIISSKTFIHDYSHKPEAIFHNYTEKTKLHYGIELELDTDEEHFSEENKLSLAKELHAMSEDESLFYLKQDGSLKGGGNHSGIEVVTHPMSYAYVMDDFNLADICNAAISHGYSNQNNTCGVHIHMSKIFAGYTKYEQALLAFKMATVLSNNWEEALSFADRTKTYYCQKPEVDTDIDEYDEEAVIKAASTCNNHYCALNTENENTYELRIFNGTVNVSKIQDYISFACSLIVYCKDNSLDKCKSVSFETVLDY